MMNNMFLTVKSLSKFDAIAIKFNGDIEQIDYICRVLQISKYKLKYIKKNQYIVSIINGGILIFDNEKEFNHAYNIVGTIENPEGGRVDETSI